MKWGIDPALAPESLESIDLVNLVGDVLAAMTAELAGARCRVTLDAPAPVLGRFRRLAVAQVATALLAHAARHGAGAPVEVRVDRAPRGLAVAAALLVVRDRGEGPCHDRLLRDGAEGRAPLQQLVDACGGRLRIDTPAGTIIVELPLAPLEPAALATGERPR